MTFSPIEIATAYHEAGHAALAIALGRAVQRVTVAPNELRLGQCQFKKGTVRASQDALETQILVLLGGLAAEAGQTGLYDSAGAAQDLRDVRKLTSGRAKNQRQAERLERRLLDKAEHILSQPGVWLAVERIAAELLRCTTLSGRAAHHLYNQAIAEAERER